jgi:hypothetical protein
MNFILSGFIKIMRRLNLYLHRILRYITTEDLMQAFTPSAAHEMTGCFIKQWEHYPYLKRTEPVN